MGIKAMITRDSDKNTNELKVFPSEEMERPQNRSIDPREVKKKEKKKITVETEKRPLMGQKKKQETFLKK